jgi:MOSC domain-containing protein YiiM
MICSIGKLIGIYIGRKKGEGKFPVESAEMVAGHGLAGDIHAGGDPDRQVSLFAMETLHELQSEGFEISPEKLSANLFTHNIPLNSLHPGAQLLINETIIEIVEPRIPCRNLTKVDNRLPKRLYGKTGSLGRVSKGGVVRCGDEIKLVVVVE